jgi:hypothetical protein
MMKKTDSLANWGGYGPAYTEMMKANSLMGCGR